MREGGLTCSFTNASPCLACALPKLNPNHLVSFPTFVFLPPPSFLLLLLSSSLSPTAGPIQCWGKSGKAAHCTPSRNQPSEEKTAHRCGETPYIIALPPQSLQPMAEMPVSLLGRVCLKALAWDSSFYSFWGGRWLLIGSFGGSGSSCLYRVPGGAFSSLCG